VRWAGHVAHVAERGGAYRFLVGKYEGNGHTEDLGIDVRVIQVLNRYLRSGMRP